MARALIGCVLVRQTSDGRTAGRIVETEAYLLRDPASHAFKGKSKRNASMFLAPYHAYVYRIYGTSFCVNVSSERAGDGAAVLLRALEPTEGIDLMQARRGVARVRDLCRGPGRLCQAMAIDLRLDGVNVLKGRTLWIAPGASAPLRIVAAPRIGITKAATRKLRFLEAGNPFVSGPGNVPRT